MFQEEEGSGRLCKDAMLNLTNLPHLEWWHPALLKSPEDLVKKQSLPQSSWVALIGSFVTFVIW